jgi:simple sugar transport system ATP-binding protein
MSAPKVALHQIRVRFGTVLALDGVDLALAPGERHAVIGENGAGKSTLMQVLFGRIAPDSGTVRIDDAPVRFTGPADAIAHGIGMVHQHFDLVAPLTVSQNIVLGAEPHGRFGMLDRDAARKRTLTLAAQLGVPIDPEARVETLSLAAQQRVEILKALHRDARLLILDEPTASLAPPEARELWAAADRLARAGTTIVFITHRLDEVLAHADAITVLRRGRRALVTSAATTDSETLATAMLGAAPPQHAPPSPPLRTRQTSTEYPALSVRRASVADPHGALRLDTVSLDVFAGEIVGVAGVDGSGQRELVDALLGLRPLTDGSIALSGTDVTRETPAARRALGIGSIPEDRHRRALAPTLGQAENLVLGRHRERRFRSRAGLLDHREIRRFFDDRAAAFAIHGARADAPASALSGGNQQKLVLARELSRKPSVLLAAQPTRGLDFAATRFVHEALRAERDRGAAVLLFTLDLDEILALADRIAVLYAGRLIGVLDRAEARLETLGALMTGVAA